MKKEKQIEKKERPRERKRLKRWRKSIRDIKTVNPQMLSPTLGERRFRSCAYSEKNEGTDRERERKMRDRDEEEEGKKKREKNELKKQ